MKINYDCLYFRGDIPCVPHKLRNVHCEGCLDYKKISRRVLIIKLGAMGDVIRTTPLVTKILSEFPEAKISWLTLTPEILPAENIHEILSFNLNSILYIQNTKWDWIINLDKDKEACALMSICKAEKKSGFTLMNGVPAPVDELAEHKFYTGIFDDVSKKNTLSYPQEIFEICGYIYNDEKILLHNHADKNYIWNLDKTKPVIGLNTGCGGRWTTRLWSTEKWIELIQLLQKNDVQILLLGGEQEDERNKILQQKTGCIYFGYFSLQQFINLVEQCTVVVTQVTMAMHISLGLQKRTVLMNNIFNPYEFNISDKNGALIQPEKECKCFYKGSCVDGTSCMEMLAASTVAETVMKQIPK